MRSRLVNFFEHQHKARKKTWVLVVYFVLAIALIIVAINAVVYVVVAQATTPAPALDDWLRRPVWIWISLATLAVIVIGTLITMLKLRGGGRAVAELVGARRVNPGTDDLNERRLINVVEEMSIASGTPVPELYVLDDEPSINAFVAGYRPTEAVMVVTRGALETFNRDELQGVVGHEYSHVLNGDMRINIRLMGILAGILLIGQIGRVMLRSGSRSRGKGSGQAAAIGLALFLIGYIGLFFGALIKAAVSRQREFLADASSVQFTRNPSGIAGALWKIKQHAEGSLLDNTRADDVSHFCFGEAVKAGFTSLMATHPPLDERIRAVDPHFVARRKAERMGEEPAEAGRPVAVPASAAGFVGAFAAPASVTPAEAAMSVGTVGAGHLSYAEKLHAAIPAPLISALRGGDTARNVIFALVLAGMKNEAREPGRSLVRTEEGEAVSAATADLMAPLASLGIPARLPLVNVAVPALKSMRREARAKFLATLQKLIEADRRYSIFEFAMLTILREHLAEDSGRDIPPRYFKYDAVGNEVRLILSVLARAGSASEEAATRTFRHVMSQFTREPGEPMAREQCGMATLGAALHKLALLAPLLKKSVVEACADCVIHDGKVVAAEAELLQAIAESLDCPMPPLLAATP